MLAKFSLTPIYDVSMCWKSLVARHAVEELHGVPFASHATQTQRCVPKMVARHLVDLHLAGERDILITMLRKPFLALSESTMHLRGHWSL